MNATSLFAAAAVVSAGAAHGTVIYSSTSNLNAQVGYACSSCTGVAFEPLDRFTFSNGYSVTGLNLWTYAGPGYDGGLSGFTFEVYNADHTKIIFSEALKPTLVYAGSRNRLAYDVVTAGVKGLHLGAGTYWAGFSAPNMGVAYGPYGNFSLIDTTPHTGIQTSVLGGDTYYQFLGVQAQGGSVPEPGAWTTMLIGLGLAGVGLRARRASRLTV